MKSEITYPTSKKYEVRNLIYEFGIFYFIWLFALAGLTKILDQSFIAIWLNEPFFFAPEIGKILIWIIPGIELILALSFAINRFNLKALYGGTAVFCIYLFYVSWNLATGFEMPCSCTGFIAEFSWNQYLFFNIFNLILSIYLVYIYNNFIAMKAGN